MEAHIETYEQYAQRVASINMEGIEDMGNISKDDVADYIENVYGEFDHKSLPDCLEILTDLLNEEFSIQQVRQAIFNLKKKGE